jgi:hypothetical protein
MDEKKENPMRCFVPGVVAALVLPAAALAQLVYPFEQERYVMVSVADYYNSPVEQSDAAADFNTWQADICVNVPEVLRYASADQYSTIGASILDAFGAGEIQASPLGSAPWDFHFSSAQSFYRVKFALADAATLDLLGHVAVEADVDASFLDWMLTLRVWVQVNQIAGEVVYEDEVLIAVDCGTWDPSEHSLVVAAPVAGAAELNPGVYELTVFATLDSVARLDALPIIGQAAYVVSAEFAPLPPEDPSQADLDGDGDVDLADFARFQRAITGPQIGG